MTLIFDFDYTLFDSKKFKEALAKASGLSPDDFFKVYKKYFTDQNKSFNIGEFLVALKEEGILNGNYRQLFDNLNNCLKDTSKYLYKDAVEMLENLKSHGHKIILATFGHSEFQSEKIANLGGLKELFSELIITDQNKAEAIKPLKDGLINEEIILINDKQEEIDGMEAIFGEEFKIKSFRVPKPAKDDDRGYEDKIRSIYEEILEYSGCVDENLEYFNEFRKALK